jgi:hypothetical protein
MPRSWANAESTKYRALLAGPLFFPWACTRANLFRPTCLIINTCDPNWRENVRLPLAHAEIFPMDFPTLPYALIFSITGIAVEVQMVANDRGTGCCCCWIVVNFWVIVAGCMCVVVTGFGSLWGRSMF